MEMIVIPRAEVNAILAALQVVQNQVAQLRQESDEIRNHAVRLVSTVVRSDRISRHPRNPLSVGEFDCPNSPTYLFISGKFREVQVSSGKFRYIQVNSGKFR